MFIDDVQLNVRAGRGGDGLVHFARRKYEPLAGPDGGDGGDGGNVILVGSRDMESLAELRYAKPNAQDGGNGGSNLMIGGNGADKQITAPLGTRALSVETGEEMGAVTYTGEQVVLAKGGKGGAGNPHFATSRNRTPRRAGRGKPPEEGVVQLQYRIFANCALLEPGEPLPDLLLPELLKRPAEQIDYGIYTNRPRWVRAEIDYRRYDLAFLPLNIGADSRGVMQFSKHMYWPETAFINLLAVDDLAPEVWKSLYDALLNVPLRRLRKLVVAATSQLFDPWVMESDEGQAEVTCAVVRDMSGLYEALSPVLVGGTVE
jgi:GTP-binding protein